jgi:hypothetical protein
VAFAVLAVIAGALLAAAEFTTVYKVVVGELEIVRTKKSGADQHSYALLILAGATVPLALGALRGARRPAGGRIGARAPATALVVLGAVALAVALLGDLPDAQDKGPLPESLSFEDARARPAGGFYLEIAGGALIIVSGAGLLVARRSGSRRPERLPAAT